MNIFILILTAIAITAVTARLKAVLDEGTKLALGKTLKVSIFIAFILGIIAGITLQMGLVVSVLDIVEAVANTSIILPKAFIPVDIFFSCVGLGATSGFFIDIVHKYKKDSEKIVEIIKVDKDNE